MPSRSAVAAAVTLAPAAANAHAAERMVVLTLPTGHYIVGAALAVALGGALAASLPRAPRWRSLLVGRAPGPSLATATSCAAFALLCALVAAGFWGSRDPLENPLVLTIWVAVWIGVTLASMALGDVWCLVSPWTGPVRLARRALGRTGSVGLARFGHLPAILGFLGFAWFEIVSLAPDDPATLARTVLIYWTTVFLLAVLEGDRWLPRGEALTAFFGYVALLAPLRVDRAARPPVFLLGPPGTGLVAAPTPSPSATAFILLALGSVSFDGFSETFHWLALIGVNPLEFPGRSAVMGVNTLGLLAAWAATAAIAAGVVALSRRVAPSQARFREDLGRLALALLPIAAGYHAAHYLVALLTQGQYAIAALSDPFGRGWNILDLPRNFVSFGFLGDRRTVLALWNLQVALVLGAHLMAIALAIRLAGPGRSTRDRAAHAPVVALMTLYTALGLWLLSAATGA